MTFMSQTKLYSLARVLLLLLVCVMWGCGCPHKYVPKENPGPLPTFCLPKKTRVALVLGSGGVRGMAHVGVLEELDAAGIPIDLIVGCSAGSIVGALYADHPDAASIKHVVWSLKTNSLLDIDLWSCRYGLSQGRSMRCVLGKYLCAQTFDQLKIPLVVVASDLHRGELVPIGSGNLLRAVQASCAIPFVFVPCEHSGRILVDGAVVNPVPVKVAIDLGADIVIAVDLCELLDRTFPTNLFQVATRSAEIAYMWQNEECTRRADVVIRPRTCGIGSFNDEWKMQLYLAGRRAAREQIPKILARLDALSEEERQGGGGWRCVQPICYTPSMYHAQ